MRSWASTGAFTDMVGRYQSISLTLVALLYFWRKIPETKRRSLQQLEQDLTG